MSNPYLFQLVGEEMARAQKRYGDPTSTHESYGVLCEEVAELFDAIRLNKLDGVRHEAIQIAAVALRLHEACDSESFKERSVK